MLRIGYGYDCHSFGNGDHIMLGGVKIPHHYGIHAHSDGDVLLHALTDALLGALALGDIGQHFPDSADEYKNATSNLFIKVTVKKMKTMHYKINNIDSTIITEAPKLSPFITHMRECIARLVESDFDRISVKAKTNEKLGWIGRGEGIAAHVVVTIAKC